MNHLIKNCTTSTYLSWLWAMNSERHLQKDEINSCIMWKCTITLELHMAQISYYKNLNISWQGWKGDRSVSGGKFSESHFDLLPSSNHLAIHLALCLYHTASNVKSLMQGEMNQLGLASLEGPGVLISRKWQEKEKGERLLILNCDQQQFLHKNLVKGNWN